jgi:hypothetical protein
VNIEDDEGRKHRSRLAKNIRLMGSFSPALALGRRRSIGYPIQPFESPQTSCFGFVPPANLTDKANPWIGAKNRAEFSTLDPNLY